MICRRDKRARLQLADDVSDGVGDRLVLLQNPGVRRHQREQRPEGAAHRDDDEGDPGGETCHGGVYRYSFLGIQGIFYY